MGKRKVKSRRIRRTRRSMKMSRNRNRMRTRGGMEGGSSGSGMEGGSSGSGMGGGSSMKGVDSGRRVTQQPHSAELSETHMVTTEQAIPNNIEAASRKLTECAHKLFHQGPQTSVVDVKEYLEQLRDFSSEVQQKILSMAKQDILKLWMSVAVNTNMVLDALNPAPDRIEAASRELDECAHKFHQGPQTSVVDVKEYLEKLRDFSNKVLPEIVFMSERDILKWWTKIVVNTNKVLETPTFNPPGDDEVD